MQGKKLITPPETTPNTLQDAYAHERIYEPSIINDPAEQTLIQNQLFAATSMAENFTRSAYITQQWIFQTTNIGPVIEIPRPRLQSIVPNSEDATSMIFVDWNDVTYPIADNTWFIDTITQPGLLIFKAGATPFPFPFGWWGYSRPAGYIQLKFYAGFGDDGTSVPYEIKAGILQIFGHLYENREGQPLIPGSIAYDILRPFQVDYL